MTKTITEVVMITCLWNNDLFAKKSPRAKFATAALRMFESQCGNILFFLENKEIKISQKLFGASLTDEHKLLFSYMISLIWKGQCMYLKGFSITKILRDYILLMWFLPTPAVIRDHSKRIWRVFENMQWWSWARISEELARFLKYGTLKQT